MSLAARKRRVPTRAHGFDAERGARGNTEAKACLGKERYTSEAAALAGIGLLYAGKALDAYLCPFGAHWHVTGSRTPGQSKAPPLHMLAFVCGRCGAQHSNIAASNSPWTASSRRTALLKMEPSVMRDGWSIGADDDHCASCAVALGLETSRGAA